MTEMQMRLPRPLHHNRECSVCGRTYYSSGLIRSGTYECICPECSEL